MTAIPAALTEAMRVHAAGRVEEAEARYAALLAEHPGHPEILHLLGTAHFQKSAWDEAARYLEEAARRDPGNPRHYLRLAKTHGEAGRPDAAIATLEALLAAVPGHDKGLQELLNLCLNHRRFAPAERELRRLLAARPEDFTLHNLLLLVLVESERFKEAAREYAWLLKRAPAQDAAFYKGYGRALHRAGRIAESIALAEEAARRFPSDVEMHILQASNYTAVGRHAEAEGCYRAAIALDPGRASLRQSAGLKRFLLTDMREGHDDYAWRHQLDKAMPPKLAIPAWRGEALAGKKLLLWAEQGIGDIAMFLGLLPWVTSQGTRVTLAAYPKLQALIRRSFPGIEVINLDLAALPRAQERWDMHAALGDLMRYALPHHRPSAHPPFLKADAARTQALRANYQTLAEERGARRIVGVSWHTANGDSSYFRSVPLPAWKELLAMPEVFWVSLQYGDHAAAIAEANQERQALHRDAEVDAWEDTDGLAAQIAAMDEIVTIQNATAHLAGALGVKTTLLLSACSDWRWGLAREGNLWYASVTILRQKEILKWEPVLRRARKALS